MFLRFSFVLLLAACLSSNVCADTITTTFSNAEGFATGATAPVQLTSTSGIFTATFTGGVQQQGFDGPSYNQGPDAYLFINGNFQGQAGTTDIGSVFFDVGADAVSFFAADRANGTPTFRVLGTDQTTVLASASITGTSNQNGAGATPFSFTSAALGAQIGGIEFDNAGPASNPPYVIAIDSFSVTAVPEPATGSLIALVFGFMGLRRKRTS